MTTTDETGWLIELRDSTPRWWDGNGEWTTDASKAIRFARKQDAETYIAEVGWTEAFASEHIWTARSNPTGAGESPERT